MRGENGYGTYIDVINSELKGKLEIDTREIVFLSRYDGTLALHPECTGHLSEGMKPIAPRYEGVYKLIEGQG